MSNEEKNPKSLYQITRIKHLKSLANQAELSIGCFENWKDEVDKNFMIAYAESKQLKKDFPKVMCFSSKKSSLMWQVYGKDEDSILVEYDFETLKKLIRPYKGSVQFQPIKYLDLRKKKVQDKLLGDKASYPFVKRPPYADEKEWRLVSDIDASLKLKGISINELIRSISVSPNAKNPEEKRALVLSLFSSVKRVSKSWLFSNEQLIKTYCKSNKKKK